MINDIVERILLEAKGKDREVVVAAIYEAMIKLDLEIVRTMKELRDEERREDHD